jgi:hypothetical protein
LSRWRQALLGAFIAALLIFAWAWAVGLGSLAFVLIGLCAAVLGLLLAIERARYKPILEEPPGAPWRETEERFVDPATGKLVSVWEDPRSGKRAYVRRAS